MAALQGLSRLTTFFLREISTILAKRSFVANPIKMVTKISRFLSMVNKVLAKCLSKKITQKLWLKLSKCAILLDLQFQANKGKINPCRFRKTLSQLSTAKLPKQSKKTSFQLTPFIIK